jgi:hypothetical protein
MAHITKETVNEKRAAIKKAFPAKDGWTFSITGGNTSTLSVNVMKYPAGYSFPERDDINHYHFDAHTEEYGEKEKAVCSKIIEIMQAGHWDKSDLQTDYFFCAYYYYLHIGKWNKPCECSKKPSAIYNTTTQEIHA